MKVTRTDRLDSEYRKEISAIFAGALKNKEPGLRGLVSVTEADVAPDLKTAKIYVSVYAVTPEEKEETLRLIRENAGFIRRELAGVMRMRTVPALTFLEDKSMEYGAKIDDIFAKLHEKQKED
ncbi:MAG: 30S ribosome-binding factor RbfA [Clostridia bacterium]|nr:30S ribosome-binding factor RbfA [Clostridia bacterium]